MLFHSKGLKSFECCLTPTFKIALFFKSIFITLTFSESAGHLMAVNLSVVVPAYNEEEIINFSLDQLKKVLSAEKFTYEVLVVNDGSSDKTLEKLSHYQKKWKNLKIINFVSNRGHMAAITAGLQEATGNWILTIDADLQDPAEVIPAMFKKAIAEKVDVVYGVRKDRSSDSFLKRFTASIYYKIMRRITESDVPANAADCRLMSRRVVDVLNSLPEVNKVYRLLVPWLGFPSSTYEYARVARTAGETHYSTSDMVKLAWESVTNFSSKPLRLAFNAGLIGITVSIAWLMFVIFGFYTDINIPGWTSLMVIILFLGSLQLLSVGLLGEYIAKIFNQLQNRPIYNLENPQKPKRP